MPKIEFSLSPVEKIPERKYLKNDSKYDPIIKVFLESGHTVAHWSNRPRKEDKEKDQRYTNYLSKQINNRAERKGSPVIASVSNNEIYLTRIVE